jgi:hypothetical protein
MKLQKNLLWIPALVALIWGLFGLFAPETLAKLLQTPAEALNPYHAQTQMVLAMSQISLGIIALWMRSLSDKKAMSGAMLVIAFIFLLFGLQAVLQKFMIKDIPTNPFIFVQGIVFLVLSVLFFLKRKAD